MPIQLPRDALAPPSTTNYGNNFDDVFASVRIGVMGVGGAGSNAVANLLASTYANEIRCVAANTDVTALRRNAAEHRLLLGKQRIQGRGAGGDPSLGQAAAMESKDDIIRALSDLDLLFLTAGMGGGTGTGAAPVIAEAARELGIHTVGIVTRPFDFENAVRHKLARDGIEQLKKVVHTLIVIPNQKLFELGERSLTMQDAFARADSVLLTAVRAVSDLITEAGYINVDFNDLKNALDHPGLALIGMGFSNAAVGERARQAAHQAIHSPLLSDMRIAGAKSVILNITAGPDLSLDEVNDITSFVNETTGTQNSLTWGVVMDEEKGNEVQVTIIATGFPDDSESDASRDGWPGSSRALSLHTGFRAKNTFMSPVAATNGVAGNATYAAPNTVPPAYRTEAQPARPAVTNGVGPATATTNATMAAPVATATAPVTTGETPGRPSRIVMASSPTTMTVRTTSVPGQTVGASPANGRKPGVGGG